MVVITDKAVSKGERPDAPAMRHPPFVHVSQLAGLLAEARRFPQGVARADLCETLTMGRNAVDRRLRTALDLNLLAPAGRGVSTGGRAPQMWRFNPTAGTVMVLSISYRFSTVALMDLGGSVIDRRQWDEGLMSPPEDVAKSALGHLEDLRAAHPDLPAVWSLGISVPAPVDFRDGTLVAPVTDSSLGAAEMSPWTGFPLRRWFAERLDLAVWVDDEVNVMALAAASRIGAPPDLLYVRVSLGLGMGIVSQGQVHRGAGAASGEIAHIQMAGSAGRRCRCGRRGCLETTFSGGAVEWAASTSQALSSSTYLREVHNRQGRILEGDVFRGVARQDRVCVRIVTEAVDRLAVVLAVLCTTYNPGEIVLGGTVTAAGPTIAGVVDQAVRRRVLPSTSERLRVRLGNPDDALIGACRLVTDRLLSDHVMHTWLPYGSPARAAELVTHRRQDA